jgi:hypothetical protein
LFADEVNNSKKTFSRGVNRRRTCTPYDQVNGR